MAITIERYTQEKADEWNAFVSESKNGTFLFDRHYMDYHSDRFQDHSLIFRNEKGKITALLPANEKDSTLYSHQGLTYGGLILSANTKISQVQSIVEETMGYLSAKSFKRIIYKPVPWIYHSIPSEEDLYVLFQMCDAHIVERSIASVINIAHQQKWQEMRRRSLRKAEKAQIMVQESKDIACFWNVLEENLKISHNAKPVHTLAEMQHLCDCFPDNIKLYIATHGDRTIGGILTYTTPDVVRTQYISANEEGKQFGAIDAIVRHLLDKFSDKQYLDLGTSTLDSGRILNETLIFQKEGFGARGVCYDTYEITTAPSRPLHLPSAPRK